jgi:hypothetical protein
MFWMPDQVRHDDKRTFYEFIYSGFCYILTCPVFIIIPQLAVKRLGISIPPIAGLKLKWFIKACPFCLIPPMAEEYYELRAGSVEHGVISFSKLLAPCSMHLSPVQPSIF